MAKTTKAVPSKASEPEREGNRYTRAARVPTERVQGGWLSRKSVSK
jgi:hypothetical protein